MLEINLDTYDIEILFDRIIDLLKKKNVDQITLNYFSLEVDDEISEIVNVNKLKEKIVEIYEADEGHFHFKVDLLSCNFDYDGGNFVIKYPEKLKEEMKIFDGDLLFA